MQMHGPQDLEQVLLGAHTLIHDAVGHAQKNGPRLSAQVRRGYLAPISKETETRAAPKEKNTDREESFRSFNRKKSLYRVAKTSQIRSFRT